MTQNNYGFSRKNADIIKRLNRIRSSGRSSTDTVYEIIKQVDPDLTKTIALLEEAARKEK